MSQGWIKLHRQVRDHWLWQVPERLRAWIDLIFMANYEDREEEASGEIFTVPRGALLTRLRDLGERWGRSKHWVSKFLDLLSQSGLITVQSSKTGTIIKINDVIEYKKTRQRVQRGRVVRKGRRSIPLNIRRLVLKRDGYRCRYCGIKVIKPHLDHILPVSRGGKNTMANLVTTCARCNLTKHARTPEEAGMALLETR